MPAASYDVASNTWQAQRAGTFTVTGAAPADGPDAAFSDTMMTFTVAGTGAAAADLTTFTAKVGRRRFHR
jgi:hypothetical protein